MRNLITFLCGVLFSITASADWSTTLGNCSVLETQKAKAICEQSRYSRELLQNYTPHLVREGGVLKRQIYLAVWGPGGDPTVILITVPFAIASGTNVPVEVHDAPGFSVEHVSGQYAGKIKFKVMRGLAEYHVYGGHHVWIPDDYKGVKTLEALEWFYETRMNLPFQDHLFNWELAYQGKQYVLSLAADAVVDLHFVPSLAFPGKSVASVHNLEIVLALIMVEQADADHVFRKNDTLTLPREYYLLGVLIELALNGPEAFRDVSSSAGARGWTQFTNTPKPKKNWPGTYNHTYKHCVALDGYPVLEIDFVKGTQDPVNAIRAALCYLDYELSQLPAKAKEIYRQDPHFGAAPIFASYNAGEDFGRLVFEQLRTLPTIKRDLSKLPAKQFRWRNGKYNDQTHYYVLKLGLVHKLLRELKQTKGE